MSVGLAGALVGLPFTVISGMSCNIAFVMLSAAGVPPAAGAHSILLAAAVLIVKT